MKHWKRLHRILGTILAPFFVLWLISGSVMIFSSYPRLGDAADRVADTIPELLPPLDSVRSRLPEGERCTALALGTTYGVPTFTIETDSGTRLTLRADSTLAPVDPKAMPEEWCRSYAARFSSYPVARIDTLRSIDTWTAYERNKKELPIYRFVFDDPEGTWLYLSGKSGRALQCCTKRERIVSSLGTVPHMFYYPGLRSHRALWVWVVSLLGALGGVMCLSGLVVGIHMVIRHYRRRHRLGSPYRGTFCWHHIAGCLFGLSLMLFALSGASSLIDLSDFPTPRHDKSLAKRSRAEDPVDLSLFATDYSLLAARGGVTGIAWRQYGTKPYYEVTYGERSETLDGSDPSLAPLWLTESDLRGKLEPVFGSPMRVELIDEYDNYYAYNRGDYELPIYRVSVEDADGSRLYVSPTGGYSRYFSRNDRLQKWLYPFCHNLRSKFFSEHSTIRLVAMLTLVLGGLVVSVTGVVMGWRYLRRLARRK